MENTAPSPFTAAFHRGSSFETQRVAAPPGLERALAGIDGSAARESHREWLRLLVDKRVAHGAGFAIVSGLRSDQRVELRSTCLNLAGALGIVVPQDSGGTLVRAVADRGTSVGEGTTARYADSRHGGNPHTDGAESPSPVPDYFTLLCVRQAAEGGELRLLHVDAVLRSLANHPESLEELRKSFLFDRRGDQGPGEAPVTAKPVISDGPDGAEISYLRKYIDIAHSADGSPPLSSAQVSALDLLDAALADNREIIEGRLAPGDFAIINNRRLLHSRTTFVDPPPPAAGRLLYRSWVKAA